MLILLVRVRDFLVRVLVVSFMWVIYLAYCVSLVKAIHQLEFFLVLLLGEICLSGSSSFIVFIRTDLTMKFHMTRS